MRPMQDPYVTDGKGGIAQAIGAISLRSTATDS